ncbi:MAG TPA: AAA family ATPase [Candidatus Binatia bacterium]|jgi:aminoglycoside phosphotransferase family enzyme/predicted kinase
MHTAGQKKHGGGSQEELVSAMLEPTFYPRRPSKVIHKETHISHVFLTDDLVYKVKKAVRFSFLDYSTLPKRRHFLNEELRLNRRLAPSVYLAVMPISFDAGGWRLGGWSEPAEYTLVMRRLPERRMLPFLLDSGQLTPEMMRSLANVLAPFHADAERVQTNEPFRYPLNIQKDWAENLAELQPFFGTWIEEDGFAALQQFGAGFLDKHHELFLKRINDGWIRDVHGDLHCEHICFAPEGIQVFDCIEFSPRLRCCDLASEIAFLLMDLEVRGGGELRRPFLTRYLELLADRDLPTLLSFYQCYRALVRGKVEALRSTGADSMAPRYFRYALRFPWLDLMPFLVIVCGLTGSGKSMLARTLGERLGTPVINSDILRKTIAGKLGRQIVPLNAGIYSSNMTEKTYKKIAQQAEKQIFEGRAAILDATFGRKKHREMIIRIAEKHKVPLLFIHCSVSEELTEQRLNRRALEGSDVSDGRWEIYAAQKAAYQPIQEVPSESCLELNTAAPVEELAIRSERFLRSRLNKTESETA